MRATLWKLHQWLGVATCVGVVLWGLSGVMHPIMSRLQPKPAQFMPPSQQADLRGAPALPRLLSEHRIEAIRQAGIAQLAGQSVWRIALPGQPEAIYLRTRDGQPIENGDAAFAAQLARHYTAQPDTPIKATRLITAFDADYPAVNRILPVWRVDFERPDGLRAYIDTEQARLATLSDHTRGILSPLFRAAHNWTFFDDSPRLQVAVMSVVLLCVLLSAGSGIYFYLLMRPSAARRLKGTPLKRWHRLLGIAVAFAALTAGVSGLYHLIHTWQRDSEPALDLRDTYRPEDLQTLFDANWQNLTAQPLARLNLARFEGAPVLQFTVAGKGAPAGPRAQVAHLAQPGEHDHHAPAAPPSPTKRGSVAEVRGIHAHLIQGGEEALAKHLAARYANQPEAAIVSTEKITRFGGEYGFVFKRLPVYRVQFADNNNPRYYVEPTTGVLAARVDDWDAIEGKSFAWLHKWHFTDAGKDLRDALLALFALGNVIVALMGLTLFIKARRPARKEASAGAMATGAGRL